MSYKLKVKFYSKTAPEQLARALQAAYDNNAVTGTFVIEKTTDPGCLQVTFDRDTQDDVEYIASRAATALGTPQPLAGVAILAAAVEQLKIELTLWDTHPAVGEVVRAMGHLGAASLDNFDELKLACRFSTRELEAYKVTYTKDVPSYGSHTIFAPKGADTFTLGRLAQKVEQEGEVSYKPKWEESGPTRVFEAVGPDGKPVGELEDMLIADGNPATANPISPVRRNGRQDVQGSRDLGRREHFRSCQRRCGGYPAQPDIGGPGADRHPFPAKRGRRRRGGSRRDEQAPQEHAGLNKNRVTA